MKVFNITDPEKFFEVVGRCKGRVELVTGEGDRLNLKSKLCQYLAITQMFKEAKIPEIELVISEPEDANILLNYMIAGS